MTELLAYCAGVIDSDGTIGITKVGDNRVARITVKQATPEAIHILHTLFRGSNYIDSAVKTGYKSLHVWRVSHQRALNCLHQIRPYLQIKRNQATVCLALPYGDKEHLYLEARRLNSGE